MNNIATLHFQKAGILTTIQDKGRFGYLAYGVPIGGAMDQAAARIANELVDNPTNSPILEVTLIGPTILVEGDVQIAITGADLSPRLNGQPIPMYETINLPADSLLSFGKINNGCRAYLAIGGTWDVPNWLLSQSAALFAPEATPQSILKKGSSIKIRTQSFVDKKTIPKAERPIYNNKMDIAVLIGPEFDLFSKQAVAQFFSQTYRISVNSNRTGYRLNGNPLDFEPRQEVISSGVLPGTIQINHAGLPIILMRDAQTTGGYFRIANVLPESQDALAQMKPGEEIRFYLSS